MAYAAATVAFAYALLSLYWAVGGRGLIGTVGGYVEQMARRGSAAVVLLAVVAMAAKAVGGRGSYVVAEVKLADDDRTYQRILGDVREAAEPGVVFDGIVMEGESLTLVLIEADEGDIDRPEELFAHRFDGRVRSWLGEHHAQGRDRVRFVYEIEKVPIEAAPGGD